MKNQFRVRGDVTIIYLMKRNKTALQCLIDTEDLEKVGAVPGSWYANWEHNTKCFRAQTNIKIDGHIKTIRMHRLIMDDPDGLVIDHINHNLLDNRKANLRLATTSENMQNLKSPPSNNSSGALNVRWDKFNRKWIASLVVNGKEYSKRSDHKNTAIKYAKILRRDLMPFSQEAMMANKKRAKKAQM